MSDIEISMLDQCTNRQLKELLALASSDVKATRHRLLEIGDSEQLECLLTEMCSDSSEAGGPLVQAVCSPQTPLDVLVAIKSTAKRMAAASEVPAQNAAATFLYHLSVASALAYHAQNISSNDPAERLPLYKNLATELSDDRLASIFEKAIAKSRFTT